MMRWLHTFDVGACAHPHPRKAAAGLPGEDAHFIRATTATHKLVVGVADGVGGAGDAGHYASMLMASAARARHTDPSQVLETAWSDNNAIEGRSTATIAVLDGTKPALRAINVGDSAFWVLRLSPRGKLAVACRSSPQQHSYNCPYQLGRLGDVALNSPSDGDIYEFPLAAGDLVLLATDGLFDALFPLEILEVAAGGMREGLAAPRLASALAGAALELSRQKKRLSPVVRAMAEHGMVARERESQDDVTVVVARVVAPAGG